MSNNIVKLSVLLSANAAQASTEIRQFATDARKAATDAKAAFDGMSTNVTLPKLPDLNQTNGPATVSKLSSSMLGFAGSVGVAGLALMGVHSIMESMKQGFELHEQAERAALSFKVFLHSAEDAKNMLSSLKGMTGMHFGDARTGASSLLRMGFDKEDVKPMLQILGDVGATSFDGMQASMQKNIQMLGVIKDQGFLTAKNMKALAMEGIEPWEALSTAMGKSKLQLKQMLEEGSISGTTGILAILTAMQEKFGGGLQENAKLLSFQLEKMQKTTAGIFADIAGIAIEMSHAEDWMPKLSEGLSGLRKDIADGTFGMQMKSGLARIFMVKDDAQRAIDNWEAEADAIRKAEWATNDLAKAEKVRIDQLKLAQHVKWEQLSGTDKQKEYEDKLELEMKQFGMTDRQKEVQKMLAQAPNSVTAGLISYRVSALDNMEQRKKDVADGAKIMDAAKLPQVRFSDEMVRLNQLLRAGTIDWAAYREEIGKNVQKMNDSIPLMKALSDVKKHLDERVQAADHTADERELMDLKKKGATNEQLQMVAAQQAGAKAAEDNKKIRDDAKKMNEDAVSGTEKAQKSLENFTKLRQGGLNGSAADLELNRIKKEYLDDQKKKNEVTAPGLALAGSQEAYKVMLNSVKVDSQKDDDKVINGMIKAAQQAADKQIIAAKELAAKQLEVANKIVNALTGNLQMIAVGAIN